MKSENETSESDSESDLDINHNQNQESFKIATITKPLVAENCSEYVVAHSNADLVPARQLNEVCFLPHIVEAMRRLHYNHLLRLQSYAWPHLTEGANHGAVIVSAPRSGRTMSYILPLCQTICSTLAKARCQLGSQIGPGPISLVLAANLKRVNQIFYLCSAFLRNEKNEEWFSKTLILPSSRSNEFFGRLLCGVGCLIVTPAQYIWLRNEVSQHIRFTKLQFVALDDVDQMQPEQLKQALKLLQAEQQHQRPQLVMTSQTFTRTLLNQVQAWNSNPLMLFGDELEAALYGGVSMQIRLLKSQAKAEEVIKVLERAAQSVNGELPRTVIYCATDEEILEVKRSLLRAGYDCLAYLKTANVRMREEVQRWINDYREEILICSDFCPELNIRNAHTLIHFTMSETWTKFKMRHLCLEHNLINPMQTPAKNQVQLQSLVLLDDSNHRQLPRLVDLLERHQCAPDERVVALARHIRAELERKKENEPPLCSLLMSHGVCGDSQCQERHHTLDFDRPSEVMPIDGNVKLQIIKVYSPTHYCVRLLAHLKPGTDQRQWQKCLRTSSASVLTSEMQLYFAKVEKRVRHWPPKAREVCVFLSSSGSFERVRLLRVAHIEHLNLARTNVDVEVQAMDLDTRKIQTTSGQLYHCPDAWKDLPPLAVDLRILGLIPETGESTWHEKDADLCRDWLDSISGNYFMQANIVFSLSHTLFVRDLIAMVYAKGLKVHVQKLNMRQKLQQERLARQCNQTESMVIDLFALIVPQEKRPEEIVEKVSAKLNQITSDNKTAKTSSIMNKFRHIAQIGQIVGLENRLRMENLQQIKENSEKDTKEDDLPLEMTDQMDDLYRCILNCAEMDGLNYAEQTVLGLLNPENNEIDENENTSSNLEATKRDQEVSTTTIDLNTSSSSSPQINCTPNLFLPSKLMTGHMQPHVTYYQTPATLELQVALPEDDTTYVAKLLRRSVIVFGTINPEPPTHFFVVDTKCCFLDLQHQMRGRTVYLSVLKKWVQPYPLAFQSYKFMKPNIDKVIEMESIRKNKSRNIQRFLMNHGLFLENPLQPEKIENEGENDANSDAEDNQVDKDVERANDGLRFEGDFAI